MRPTPPSKPHAPGDQDLICNWLGNRRWVDALDWEGAQGWAQVGARARGMLDEGATRRLGHARLGREGGGRVTCFGV